MIIVGLPLPLMPLKSIYSGPLRHFSVFCFFLSGKYLVNSTQKFSVTLNTMAEGKCSSLIGNAAWTVHLEKIDKMQPATVARQQ